MKRYRTIGIALWAMLLSLPTPTAGGEAVRPVASPGSAAEIPLTGEPGANGGPFRHLDAFPPGRAVFLHLPAWLAVAGRVDVYVVKARDRHDWRASPVLDEARAVCPTVAVPGMRCSGGEPPCRCTMDPEEPAGELPVAMLVSPGDLATESAPCLDEGCLGVGAGYDVVIDRDLDGRLGAADLIDGGGDRTGFHLLRDPSLPVLDTVCVDYGVEGFPPLFARQRLYFPREPARLDSVPLVVISHGAGHDYSWYGYLQRHLAANGYAVMSHTNQTRCFENPYPGCNAIDAAAEMTLRHTDALLDVLLDEECADRVRPQSCNGAEVADPCTLAGVIDPRRLVWIGHSRGGTGVVWAYDRLAEGEFTPQHFGPDDVALLSTLAPTDRGILGERADPGTVPFHLLYGAADNDVGGRPTVPDEQGFLLFERAAGSRHADYLHGVGHGWFHGDCSPGGDPGCDFATGPAELLIGVEATHAIVRSLFVPLLAHYLRGESAAEETLWRPWRSLAPPGGARDDRIRVVRDYRPAGEGVFVIDDHQSNPGPSRTSAGTRVRHDLDPVTLFEGPMRDDDCTLDWLRGSTPGSCGCFADGGGYCRLRCEHFARQPMNGMTRSRGDESRGVVLEWPPEWGEPPFVYELEWPVGAPAGAAAELSLRLAQMPRHPKTVALGAELDLHVALVDEAGRTARVSLSQRYNTISRPYPRRDLLSVHDCTFGGQCGLAFCCPEGCDPRLSGEGWQAEFETVRIPLADFAAAGRIDIDRPRAVRLELGVNGASGANGAALGRIAIDDVLVVGERGE